MTAEEETLEKIKYVLSMNNDSQARRIIEQYGHYRHEQALQLQQGGVSGSASLREQFYKETNIAPVFAQRNPYIQYINWLEEKLT